MIEYEILSATQAHQCLPELGDVLQACVKDGASVGFTDPNDRRAIDSFWKDKIYSLASHDCELFIARDNGFLAATVFINYCRTPNGRHRAEISKLLVHPQARRQGIARELMNRAEAMAREKRFHCLFLIHAVAMSPAIYIFPRAGRLPGQSPVTQGLSIIRFRRQRLCTKLIIQRTDYR